MAPNTQPKFDNRYECSMCNRTSRVGYIDRLKKGVPEHQSRSLQYHVETYHSHVTDWRSLKVDLPSVLRGSASQASAAAVASSVATTTAAAQTDGTTDVSADQDMNDDETHQDDDHVMTQNVNLPTHESNDMAQSAQVEGTEDFDSTTDDAMTIIQTTEERQRDEITALQTSNRRYMSTINHQAAQNHGLLECVINSVEAMLKNGSRAEARVWECLMTLSNNDKKLTENIFVQVIKGLNKRELEERAGQRAQVASNAS